MAGQFGIYFDTRYYGEKRLQPSRRSRDAGKIVSSRKHFLATWSYMKMRQQERGLDMDGQRVKLNDDQKHFNPLSPSARMTYFGLPFDPNAAWKQCQESASENVTFRYYEFGPDPTLVEVLFELGRADLIRPLVVEGFYEGLRAYCTENYGAREPPDMTVAYHEKFDQFGRPQPHLHALSEATLINGDADRVEMKLFKEQLAELRLTLDTAQGVFLDRQLPDIPWHELYRQRHLEWEMERTQLEQEQLGQEIEVALIQSGLIEPSHALSIRELTETDKLSPVSFELSYTAETSQAAEGWDETVPTSMPFSGTEQDEEDDLPIEADEPELDFDDF